MNTQFVPALQSSTQSPPPPLPITKEEINALHNRFQTYGQSAKEWIRKCQLMLPEIKEKEVWKRKGFSSIYEYARVLAGMSTFAVDDALWVMKKLEGKPNLKKVANEKGLNAVRPVLSVATEDDEKEWAKKAVELSHHALRIYVEEVKRTVPKESCDVTGQNSENRMSKSIYMKLDVKTIERMKRLKGDMNWDEMLNEMLDVYESPCNTASHCKMQEKPAPVNTGKRYIPREIQKYVTNKTSGLCAYPGCSKPYEILHHTKRFAIDGAHDPDTIKPLCKAHERLAHKGLIENEEIQPVEFTAGGCGGESGMVGMVMEDKAGVKINWALRTKPDTNNPKCEVDKKVNEYYAPKF